MDWVNERETTSGGDFFKIVEGDNRIQLLTHAVPFYQKWTGTKYEPAQDGDHNLSIRGVCWVLQDNIIKLATLPYTIVKQIRALMDDEDWSFSDFPMPHLVNIRAKGAGTKEVEYSLVPSPNKQEVSKDVLSELAKKPSPEEMVEKLKNKAQGHLHLNESEEVEDIGPIESPF